MVVIIICNRVVCMCTCACVSRGWTGPCCGVVPRGFRRGAGSVLTAKKEGKSGTFVFSIIDHSTSSRHSTTTCSFDIPCNIFGTAYHPPSHAPGHADRYRPTS